jgi:hypothetical protein
LPHFHQLNAKILHGLQRTVKFCLIAEDPNQDRAARCLFDVQVQSLQRSDECISQLTAYADLIGEAPSASGHDREVAAWPLAATAQLAKTVMLTIHGFALGLVMDMPPLHRLTRDAIDR